MKISKNARLALKVTDFEIIQPSDFNVEVEDVDVEAVKYFM
jgi:hypothetical protein